MPNIPHHITQRGNRRQTTFFCDDDYHRYLELLVKNCRQHNVSLWCYCLMPNHVHLIAVPQTSETLSRAIGNTHESYTREVNARQGWQGYLWQGRYFSCPMDEVHVIAAARYILMNPVRAGLVENPWQWPYSSLVEHLGHKQQPPITDSEELSHLVKDWKELLAPWIEDEKTTALKTSTRVGRPAGSEEFLRNIEKQLGRELAPKQRGRKKMGA